jgi:hypothetical protein
MAFDWNLAKAGDFKKDSVISTAANDIASKRSKLIQAIDNHIQAHLHQKPIMERKAKQDESGNIVKDDAGKTVYEQVEKSRVIRMSNPTKDKGMVVCQLKYGNIATIPLNGMNSVIIPEDVEEDMWADIKQQIRDKKLDKLIEKAAAQATPKKKR